LTHGRVGEKYRNLEGLFYHFLLTNQKGKELFFHDFSAFPFWDSQKKAIFAP